MAEKVQYEMSLNDLVSPKIDNAEKHVKHFESSLGGVHKALGELAERAVRVTEVLGISFGIYKIAEFAHESIEMAHQLGQAEAQVKAGIISTNGAAGVSFEELEESSKKFAATLPFTQAQIVDMQSQMVTFPGITKRVFNEASIAIMDMSARLHKGLDETAIMVGKALQDPEKGITAMRRVGVNFNAEQTKVIKNLVETGHVAKAQTMILGELQNEFAGSAKAAADADPLFRYNKLMESLKIEVGEAGESFIKWLTPGLETAVEYFHEGYEALKVFGNFLVKNKETIEDVGIVVGSAAGALLLYNGALKAMAIWEGITTAATSVWTAAQWALNVALNANPIGIVVVAIGALVGGLIVAYRHSDKFRAVLAGIGEVAKDVWSILKGLGEAIIGLYLFNPKMIQEGIQAAVDGVKDIKHAFSRGYDESMAESAKKEKAETTMGKLAEKRKNMPVAATTKKPGEVSKVSGSKVLNINVHIGALVKELKIQTTNFKEGVSRAQGMVTEALLSAVNDSQLAAGD